MCWVKSNAQIWIETLGENNNNILYDPKDRKLSDVDLGGKLVGDARLYILS